MHDGLSRNGYRIQTATTTDITTILQQMTGNVHYCSASLYHNVDVKSARYQAITDIQIKSPANSVDYMLLGDFGRIFNSTSELRWKRTRTGFDVLLLTTLSSTGFHENTAKIGTWTQSLPLTYITKHGKLTAVRCHTQSGQVQFVCYCDYQS